MRTLRATFFTILILSAVSGLTAVAWQFKQLIDHHRLYIVREGMWPTVEEERTILELRDAVVRISLGDTISAEDYHIRRGLAFSRAEIVRGLVDVKPTYSAEQRQLIEQLKQQFDTYASIDGSHPPDQETAKRLVPILDGMVVMSHDLVNFRRDVAYQVSRETFVYIDKLIVLLMVTLACLFVSGIGFFWITNKTLHKNVEIAQLQRHAAEQEREVAIARTRVTIASELHDVFNYHFAIIVEKLNRAQKHLDTSPTISKTEISEARARTKLAWTDVRTSVHALRNGNIQPLEQAMQALDSGGLDVRVEVLGAPHNLPNDVAFAAYRIAQEAFANTLKHAPHATSITVRLDYQPQDFSITIEDDGGIQSDTQRTETGIGLLGMQERASQLRGSFQHGRTNRGYYVQATFPTEQRHHATDSRPDR